MDILTFVEEKVTVEVVLSKKGRKRRTNEVRKFKLIDSRIEFLNKIVTEGKDFLLVPKKVNVLQALIIFNRWSHHVNGTDNRVYAVDSFTLKRLAETDTKVYVDGEDEFDAPTPEVLTKNTQLKDGDIIYCNHLNEHNMRFLVDIVNKVDVKIVTKEINLDERDELFLFNFQELLKAFGEAVQ